jgi:uncharacterized protein YegL
VPGTQASDIALVLDRSSSMDAQNKLRAAIEAIQRFVDGARVPPDQLALVTFANVAGVNQLLAADKVGLRRALGGVLTSGGTRIDLGLQAARHELASQRHRSDHASVMILLSDGVQAPGAEANVAVEADAAKAAGILVFTIALGSDADQALLRSVATSPSHAYVAPTAADLAAIYARIAVAIPCPPTAPPPATATPTPTGSTPATPTRARPTTATPDGPTATPGPMWHVYLPFARQPRH